MRTREEVLREFDAPLSSLHTQRMADRIRELESPPRPEPVVTEALDVDALRDLAEWCQKVIDASPCCESCDGQWRRRRRALTAALTAASEVRA